MNIRTVTGIATACLVVVGGIGCAQNRAERTPAPTTTTSMETTAPVLTADSMPATTTDGSLTRDSSSSMGSTGTMGASTPYSAPATSKDAMTTTTSDTTPAPQDQADMRPPQSDRN